MTGDPIQVSPEGLRLNASEEAPLARIAARRQCLDCGQDFPPRRPHGEFCSPRCRMRFANRRASRGAELYDLFMASRFELEKSKDLKLWRMMNRMASGFREQDRRERDGRRSWMRPEQVLEAKAYLYAQAVAPVKRRSR